MVANFMDKGGQKGASGSDMQAAKTTEKEGLLAEGDEDEDEDEEQGGVRHRHTPPAVKDPFGDVMLSPITALEVETAKTPDESSDGDFEVLVEVDRVTPVKSPGDIQVEVDRVTPVASTKGSSKVGKGKRGK